VSDREVRYAACAATNRFGGVVPRVAQVTTLAGGPAGFTGADVGAGDVEEGDAVGDGVLGDSVGDDEAVADGETLGDGRAVVAVGLAVPTVLAAGW
jgi:hypothetical protein